MSDREVRLEQLLPLIEQTLAEGKTVHFTPEGRSMLPTIVGGRDSVELAPLPEELHRFDAVLYRRENGQFVLHRITEVREDGYLCMGDAQFVPEPVRRAQMIAVVRSFTHNGRTVTADSEAHRRYCAVRAATFPVRKFAYRAAGWLKRRIGK